MNIVSLQSHVAYGHVGNSAAAFAMQRLGHEVWPVYTVNFSNHTEYPNWGGPVMDPQHVKDVLDGFSFAYDQVDLIVTGYLGSPELAQVVHDAVARIKEANPRARYICDPVIGNAEVGSFVSPEMPDVFREVLIPLADAITPNEWEFNLLDVDLPPRALITSVGSGPLSMIDISPAGAFCVSTPRLGGNVVGTGDLATALYAAMFDDPARERLAHLGATMFDFVSEVRGRNLPELPLIQCQELLVRPRSSFPVVEVEYPKRHA